MISKREQAEFLAEAMPYIKKYNDKILVIKYGGNAMIDEELKTSVMRDLVHGKQIRKRTSLYRRRNGGSRPHGAGGKDQ